MAEETKPQTNPNPNANPQSQLSAAEKKALGKGSIVHVVTAHGDHLPAKIVSLDKGGKFAELTCYLPGDKKKSPSTIKQSPLDLTRLTPDSWHPVEAEDEGEDDGDEDE